MFPSGPKMVIICLKWSHMVSKYSTEWKMDQMSIFVIPLFLFMKHRFFLTME